MLCPNCKNQINSNVKDKCFICGAVFDLGTQSDIKLFFELNDSIKKLQEISSTFNDLIDKTNLKLKNLEDSFNRYLHAEKPSIKTLNQTSLDNKTSESFKSSENNAISSIQNSAKLTQQTLKTSKSSAKTYSDKKIEADIGQKWFLIIGIITMVFGIGYFLKYSFEQGWISPFWRIITSYIWGTTFLFAGNKFRNKGYPLFGLNIIGGGIAVLYFSAFAAFQLYHLIDQIPSFLIMISITTLCGILSLRYDAKGLACLGIFGGFLTPIFLTTNSANHIVLFSYITILNLGIFRIAFHKQWKELNTLGFLATYILYAGWFHNNYLPEYFWSSILFLNLFFLMYTFIPFIYDLANKDKSSSKNYYIIFPNSFLSFGFSYYMISHYFTTTDVSIITIIYAAIFLSFANYLYRNKMVNMDVFVFFLGKAGFYIFITIPIYFSGHWITVFWIIQAMTLFLIGAKLKKTNLKNAAYMLSLIVIYKFLMYDYNLIYTLSLYTGKMKFFKGYPYLIIERYINSLLLITSTLWLNKKIENNSAWVYSIISGAILFIILNIETIAFFNQYYIKSTFAAVSVLWSLISITMMIVGFYKNNDTLRKLSIALFFITLLKVFFKDMANISTPARILSFIVLGMLLIITSYMYHRFRDRFQILESK